MSNIRPDIRSGDPRARRPGRGATAAVALSLIAMSLITLACTVPAAAAPAPGRAGAAAAAVPPAGTAAPAADPCTRGHDLYRQGHHEAARPALLECLGTGGDKLDVLLPLTVIALEADDPGQALDFAGRAVTVAPDDAEAMYWHGRALLANGRRDEARAEWVKALQQDAWHLGVLEGLARLAMADGNPTQAYQFLMQMRQRGVDQAWLHRLLADIAAGKGLWPQALAHLQDALSLEPDNAADWLSASQLAIVAGDDARAVEYGRHAVALQPDAASLGGLGEAFFAAEQVDSSLVYLRRAVAVGDASSRTRFNLANALEVAGLTEEAGQRFREFLKAEPNDPVGHFNYAIHLQKDGQLEAALAEDERALALDPKMLTAAVVRVQILEDLTRWDQALAGVAELKKRDPDSLAELNAWELRLTQARDGVRTAEAEGKFHLLHMVLNDRALLAKVTAELARGADFASLVVQYSTGPAAARGGDIGWVRAEDMVEPLRTAILRLQPGETSPPIESKGLIHLFKRLP